ncbi:hypothetical protein F5Y18DRAFT_278934 [Xylariaceae sp. FL1019]|nr:hypothetical protein F5Y18DRAFT_278934 [Xylariaceae sp. FL1019]
MGIIQYVLHATNFRSPLLRTVVPSITAAFALQTAVAIPSIALQSSRLYDVSSSATFLTCTLLSLYLPSLRIRDAVIGAGLPKPAFPSLLEALPKGTGPLNWRQVALSAAVVLYSVRLGSHLFSRRLKSSHDSHFDEIKKSPVKFASAWFGQATWVSLCLMPVLAVNAVPAIAFPSGVVASDILGLALFAGGFACEVVADRQKSKWLDEKTNAQHDKEFLSKGLWSRSQFPNYFGEITLWTGIATTAAGVLLSRHGQLGLGFSGGAASKLATMGLCYISPALVSFLLLKVTGVPLSEEKCDARYGDRKDYQEWKTNTPKFFPRIF